MGMSAWGLFITPIIAATSVPGTGMENGQEFGMAIEQFAADDIFGTMSTMDDMAMVAASGGSGTAIDITSLGVNIAENEGYVSEIETNNTITGEIAGNLITNNRGITTVLNNTGNGVILQSNVNVNIFLNGGN